MSLIRIFVITLLSTTYAFAAFDLDVRDTSIVYQGAKNAKDGRYVKFVFHNENRTDLSQVVCIGNGSSLSIGPKEAANFLGKNVDAYYICNDANGNDCQLIGKDTYTINKVDGHYESQPTNHFTVNLTSLKDKFVSCNNIGSTSSQQTK